jgi:sugar phosphate isomerase/epimerase
MKIKILSPIWGHEHVDLKLFLDKVRDAGYDGVDTWLPPDLVRKKHLYDYLEKHEMYLVAHQHEATGSSFDEFKSAYLKNLNACAEAQPILINSHTGRDYFSFEQLLELIDMAEEFSAKTGITIAHETHRGRAGYSPQMTNEVFKVRRNFYITADLSHWVCVTESMLQNFTQVVDEAIKRTKHIHTRVGFEEGPQVPDPRAPEWKYALDIFFGWWDRMVDTNAKSGTAILPMTTEFGPVPYMPTIPFTNKPVADQFEINCYMKDLLRERYQQYI